MIGKLGGRAIDDGGGADKAERLGGLRGLLKGDKCGELIIHLELLFDLGE